MAEYDFTYYFKINLADCLQKYFEEYKIELKVETEYSQKVWGVENKIDIGIFEKNKENSLIGIEIEFISNRNQIKKNYTNFKRWVHSSKNRTGGLLHIIFKSADLDGENVYKLFLKSYDDTSEGKKFFYEFFYIDKFDRREYNKLAKDLVLDNWEFDARFFSLIIKIFGDQYLTKLK